MSSLFTSQSTKSIICFCTGLWEVTGHFFILHILIGGVVCQQWDCCGSSWAYWIKLNIKPVNAEHRQAESYWALSWDLISATELVSLSCFIIYVPACVRADCSFWLHRFNTKQNPNRALRFSSGVKRPGSFSALSEDSFVLMLDTVAEVCWFRTKNLKSAEWTRKWFISRIDVKYFNPPAPCSSQVSPTALDYLSECGPSLFLM